MNRYQFLALSFVVISTSAVLLFLRVGALGMSWTAFWGNFTGTLLTFSIVVVGGALLAVRVAQRPPRRIGSPVRLRIRRFVGVLALTLALGWLLVAVLLSGV